MKKTIVLVVFIITFSSLLTGISLNSKSNDTKTQNDLGFIFGIGGEGNGDLYKVWKKFSDSEGWQNTEQTSTMYLNMEIGMSIKVHDKLYAIPQFRLMNSSTKKTMTWEDLGGYQQDKSTDVTLCLPGIGIKYYLYSDDYNHVTLSGIISKINPSTTEDGLHISSAGLEKGAAIGYEFGPSVKKHKSTGYGKARSNISYHIICEAGFSSIPVKIHFTDEYKSEHYSSNSDIGSYFMNLKTYIGAWDWK